MTGPMAAIEMTGTVDEHSQLTLDGVLPLRGPLRVRVIVLSPPGEADDECAWWRAVTASPAFASLREPEEDLYTLADGKPFHDEG